MKDEEIVYIAECLASQCAAGSVVMSFPTSRYGDEAQNERNRWARLHTEALGHRVACYHRWSSSDE